jgi:hypothetical protein
MKNNHRFYELNNVLALGLLGLCLVIPKAVLAQARLAKPAVSNMVKEDVQDRELYFARLRGLQFGVPKAAYSEPLATVRPLWRSRSLQGGPSLSWQFIGPQPILENQANFAGVFLGTPLTTSTGRVTAVAPDRPGTHRIFVGTAAGGVWMSNDDGGHFDSVFDSSTVVDRNGTVISAFVPTQVVGSIVLDTTTDPTTVYVGTGEGNGGDSYYGEGIFKSKDLGKSWVQLGKDLFSQRSVAALALDTSHNPPHLFAGITSALMFNRADIGWVPETDKNTGLWRSLDGGITWQHYIDPQLPPSPSEIPSKIARNYLETGGPYPVLSVAVLPNDPSTVLAGVAYDALFRSTNGGDSWEPVTLTDDDSKLPYQGRQTIAASPNPQPNGTVYAVVGDSDSFGFIGLFESTNSGGNWIPKNVPSAGVGPSSLDGEGSYAQEDYDQALAIEPSDRNATHLVFGGVGLYTSNDSGKLWTFIARAGGTHADQHALAYTSADGSGRFLVGNDGGLYLYDPIQEAFSSLNSSISATQIQSIAPHPTDSSKVLAGFQDNGTELYTGQLGWKAVESGDGGMTLFDSVDPNLAYHTFSTDSRDGPTLAISTNGGADWDSEDPSGPAETAELRKVLTANHEKAIFYPPLAVDPKVKERLFFGATHVYVSSFSKDGTWVWQRQEPNDLTSGCQDPGCSLANIEFDKADPTRACALSPQFVQVNYKVNPIVKTTFPFKLSCTKQANLAHSGVWSDLTPRLERAFPTGKTAKSTQATGVSFDPNDANKLYVSLSGFTQFTGVGHVYCSTDFGQTWTRADGVGGAHPLPDVPVLRLLVDSTDKSGATLLAGTDIGIFRTVDAGKNWSIFNLNTLPPVPVFDIQQNRPGTIFAGTHGRGAYRLTTTR